MATFCSNKEIINFNLTIRNIGFHKKKSLLSNFFLYLIFVLLFFVSDFSTQPCQKNSDDKLTSKR